MKSPTNYRRAGKLALGLAGGASLITAAVLAGSEANDEKGFLGKVQEWQDKMSEKFRDTWKGLRTNEKGKATASVDLREGPNQYIVRLSLPNRDVEKVEIKVEGNTLRIVAPESGEAERYEQNVALAEMQAGAQPKIDRRPKDNMIVVTVPKGRTGIAGKPLVPFPGEALAPLTDWDQDVFSQMEKMREEMDRTFAEAFKEFSDLPEHRGFFDESRFGSSVDLKDQGDHYVVHAYLPDRGMQNVNVEVKDGMLKIEAKEEALTKKGGKSEALHSTRKAAYSQILTLPGPVEADKMQVEKKEGLVVVTIPKAK
jgi:HSP20 family molecular chaperone IbpA